VQKCDSGKIVCIVLFNFFLVSIAVNTAYVCCMIRIYGIKNCDTMQKAFKWLDANNETYHFHNYKTEGIDKATIDQWLKVLPLEKVINSKGTTYRNLEEADKEALKNKKKAIAVLIANPSVIKRPIWDLGNDVFFAGWDEQALSVLLS
jgi:arsenate reductase (glutaredoxin)